MFANRPMTAGSRPRYNYDAFDVALNGWSEGSFQM
jgi:hypothetical protein